MSLPHDPHIAELVSCVVGNRSLQSITSRDAPRRISSVIRLDGRPDMSGWRKQTESASSTSAFATRMCKAVRTFVLVALALAPSARRRRMSSELSTFLVFPPGSTLGEAKR